MASFKIKSVAGKKFFERLIDGAVLSLASASVASA